MGHVKLDCFYQLRPLRSWTDQAHFTLADVPQLGQFVFPLFPAATKGLRVPAQTQLLVSSDASVIKGVVLSSWRFRIFAIATRRRATFGISSRPISIKPPAWGRSAAPPSAVSLHMCRPSIAVRPGGSRISLLIRVRQAADRPLLWPGG